MGTAVYQCDACQRSTEKVIRSMCPRCYRRHWVQTPAGKRRQKAKAEGRKLPPTAAKRLYNGDEWEPTAGIWKVGLSLIPEQKQREAMARYLEGEDAKSIAKSFGLTASQVQAVIDRGTISPQQLPTPRRCPGCRNLTRTEPCFMCEAKAMASRRKLVRQA